MKIVAMANRAQEVIDDCDLDAETCRVSCDKAKVSIRLARSDIESAEAVGLVNISGESFTTKPWVRSFEASPYGSSMILTTKKEHNAQHGFSVELRIAGWLVEGKCKDQVT